MASQQRATEQELKEKLQIAEHRMKQQADTHRREKEFSVGDWVYLKLQPYKQTTVALRKHLKLTARYYGPFEVIERIGEVAYRLRLPEGTKIYPVFHVSLLKKDPSTTNRVSPTIPLTNEDGQLLAEPEGILERRMVKKGNRAVTEVRVKWSNLPEEKATWEEYELLRRQFPAFDP